MLIVVMALVLAVLAAERRCSTVGRQWNVTRPRQHSEEHSSVSLTRGCVSVIARLDDHI